LRAEAAVGVEAAEAVAHAGAVVEAGALHDRAEDSLRQRERRAHQRRRAQARAPVLPLDKKLLLGQPRATPPKPAAAPVPQRNLAELVPETRRKRALRDLEIPAQPVRLRAVEGTR
jgi:hypothetical protein